MTQEKRKSLNSAARLGDTRDTSAPSLQEGWLGEIKLENLRALAGVSAKFIMQSPSGIRGLSCVPCCCHAMLVRLGREMRRERKGWNYERVVRVKGRKEKRGRVRREKEAMKVK